MLIDQRTLGIGNGHCILTINMYKPIGKLRAGNDFLLERFDIEWIYEGRLNTEHFFSMSRFALDGFMNDERALCSLQVRQKPWRWNRRSAATRRGLPLTSRMATTWTRWLSACLGGEFWVLSAVCMFACLHRILTFLRLHFTYCCSTSYTYIYSNSYSK